MAPMKRGLGMIGVRLGALVAAALLLCPIAICHSAVAQSVPSEQDLGQQAPDLEPGDGPPMEADTPEGGLPEMSGKPPPGQTGLKVPRFASLRSGEVNVRTGPGTRYPVEWQFVKRGLPIEITAEFGTWRRITDGQGGDGWVHRSMLSGRRAGIVIPKIETIRRRASTDSPAVAKAEQGVVVAIRVCRDKWCEVDVQGFRGWLPQTSLWGVFPTEIIK
jgi:SH3-like domain-containing protein